MMKLKNIYKTLLASMVIFVSSSCEDYLDVSPDLGLGGEEVYSSYETFRGAVDRNYYTLHNYAYDVMDWDSEVGILSDEAQITTKGQPSTNTYNPGLWIDSNGREFSFKWQEDDTERHWNREPSGEATVGIRMSNLALENLELLEEFPDGIGFTPEELKNQLEGETRLLRAWHYFQIIQRFGGIMLLNRPFTSSDLIDSTRRSYAECTDWLISDLDKAITLLPETLPQNALGRATVTSAKAIKTMALLYAASPNMSVFDGGSDAYNNARCEQAADAALETIASATAAGYAMYEWTNYSDNWYRTSTGISTEALWGPPQSPMTSPTGNSNNGLGWWMPGWDGGWGNSFSSPTQNTVDRFETLDGYSINDAPPASYDPQDPYANRDPRLDQFIWKNGDNMYLTDPSGTSPTLESWIGSNHYNQANEDGIWTGFLHKKHRWPGQNRFDNVSGYFRTMPFIRLAQTYLDFAEAANEAYGPNVAVTAGGLTMTAVEAVNVVRARVGMPDVLAMYTGDKETFRGRIRNERAVELYQEMHRFHDIRRWRIAHVVMKHIYAAENINSNGTIIYGKKELERARVFEEKHYWYPFPTSEMNLVQNFAQNPGW
ncbi:MAG: RagB/SusD family nutrient uptake outer membrane protein [Reichenbachiella sp.]